MARFGLRAFGLLALLAFLAWSPGARAEGVAPDLATKEQTRAAQKHYQRGVQLYQTKKFGQAAELFRQSYETVASPNSHMMWARALAKDGDLTAAYEEMALAEEEAATLAERLPKYAATADKAKKGREELGAQVAVLVVEIAGSAPEAELSVGPRVVPPSRWKGIAVMPGKVDVVARIPGGRRVWELVDVTAGETKTIELDLAQASEEPSGGPGPKSPIGEAAAASDGRDTGQAESSSLRPYAYVAGSIGAAGLVTFAVAGSMTKSTFDDLKGQCPDGRCPPEASGDIDKGERQKRAANVGLSIGLVGLAAGAGLFIFDLTRDGGDSASRRTQLAVTPTEVVVRGRF